MEGDGVEVQVEGTTAGQTEPAHGVEPAWTLVIGPAWQASESFVLEDLGDGDRTKAVALVSQIAAVIVDREVLFAEVDDEIAEGIGFGWEPLGSSLDLTVGVESRL
jgi:hypothetical protein